MVFRSVNATSSLKNFVYRAQALFLVQQQPAVASLLLPAALIIRPFPFRPQDLFIELEGNLIGPLALVAEPSLWLAERLWSNK